MEEKIQAAEQQAEVKKKSAKEKVPTIIGIVLCAILIPMLIINVIMIINSFAKKDEVPGFFGFKPMIVLTESMHPTIKGGDLIVCKKVEADEIKEGDIISFFDPMSTKGTVVTHRVKKIIHEDGKIYFKTRGDNNAGDDYKPVPEENLVGRYCFRIPWIGRVLMFMQTTAGLITCIGVPLALLIGFEIFRRRKYEKGNQEDLDQMRAELEALRAEKERQEAAEAVAAEQVSTEDQLQTDEPIQTDEIPTTPPEDKDEG